MAVKKKIVKKVVEENPVIVQLKKAVEGLLIDGKKKFTVQELFFVLKSQGVFKNREDVREKLFELRNKKVFEPMSGNTWRLA